MNKEIVAASKKFTLEQIKEILLDAKNIGPVLTMKKWDIKRYELSALCHSHEDMYYTRHKYTKGNKEKTLQDKVFLLRYKGYTSKEAAKELNMPIEIINDLWVFVK